MVAVVFILRLDNCAWCRALLIFLLFRPISDKSKDAANTGTRETGTEEDTA